MMKTKLTQLSLAIALFAMSFTVSAQIDTPAPSPAGSATSVLGLTDIEINYSRPQMKGRKIFGEGDDFLIPFGKMWRAGANSGTTMKFSNDVKIEGKDLKAGEYLIFAIPGKDEWTITFYSDLSLGGNVGGYDEKNEVLRVTSKSSKLSETVSSLTYGVSDISEDSKTANIIVLHTCCGRTNKLHFTLMEYAKLVTYFLSIGEHVRAIENSSFFGLFIFQKLFEMIPSSWIKPTQWLIKDKQLPIQHKTTH